MYPYVLSIYVGFKFSISGINLNMFFQSLFQLLVREVSNMKPTATTGRRDKLPTVRPNTEGLSLWSLLTKNIGKDLSQVSMPVGLNEPLNMLQVNFIIATYIFTIYLCNIYCYIINLESSFLYCTKLTFPLKNCLSMLMN